MVKDFSEDDIQNLSTSALQHRCSQESERFFNRQANDPRYCFELFQRAILKKNQRCWDLIYRQYQPLVTSWVERHSSFQNTGEEKEFFVNGTFEKMWRVVTPEKFTQFPDLKSILRYMQMCVHSVIMDHIRKKEQALLWEEVPKSILERANQDETIEESIVTHDQRQALWESLNRRLKNDKEQQVVYGTFILALKPSELLTEFRGVFKDAKEIYQIKANIIDRLRRDREFCEILSNF